MSEKKSIKGSFFELIRAIRSNKKEYNLASLGIIIFTLYIYIQRWFALSPGSGFIQIAIVAFAFFLIVGKDNLKIKLYYLLTKIELFWLIGIVVIFINIISVGFNEYYLDIFMYTVGFTFILLTKVKIDDYKAAFSIISLLSLVYALGTIMQFYFTDLFNSIIFNFADAYTQSKIIMFNQQNYYPGFGFAKTAIAPGLMVFGLGSLFTFLDSKNKKSRYISIFIIAIILFGLVISGRRSILLWASFALIFVYLFSGDGKERIKRLFYITVLVSACAMLFWVNLQYSGALIFLERINMFYEAIIAGLIPESLHERLLIYRDAWTIAVKEPLLGIGWRNFISVTAGNYSKEYHVHNLYLQLFCETGIVGLTAIMLPISYTYYKTFRAIKLIDNCCRKNMLMWRKGLIFALFYQTFFLLYSLTDNPFYELTFILKYFFAISIVNLYIFYSEKNLRDFNSNILENEK